VDAAAWCERFVHVAFTHFCQASSLFSETFDGNRKKREKEEEERALFIIMGGKGKGGKREKMNPKNMLDPRRGREIL